MLDHPPRTSHAAVPPTVSEHERVLIHNAVEQAGENGQVPSQREVCSRVFSTTGGQGYRKVQVALDQVAKIA
jgi:hypothetical protein